MKAAGGKSGVTPSDTEKSDDTNNEASNCNEQKEKIAVAAYYRAEARGFFPGQEMDDWLAAETEINAAA